ncbi:hypothetical protein [Microbacterium sp. cf332]|uniref:hypothetical protein n=1 Tax=Microbacterium sp. cf332 TaxID=1761804 RepID=UPI00088F3994|nr:hypothetical protein [Microbacterium sp. cf332]SDQ27222.1 hypothetical protein SAMN04487847_1179 [Microbacterium sp. cf332]
MSTTLTPPPATPPGPPAEPAGARDPGSARPAAPSSAARAVAGLTVAAGAAVILFTAGTGVVSTVASGGAATSTLTAPVDGVGAIELDAAASDVEVSFGDVDEATLTVTGTGGADAWELNRTDDRLVVDSDRDWWSGWRLWGGSSRATLVLPVDLAGVDADLRVGAGSLRADGEFGALGVRAEAGSVDAAGTAESLTARVSAGRVAVDLDGVRTATVDVSAGRLSGTLAGSPPASLTVSAEAGGVDLTLPRGGYAVSSTEEAGSFISELTDDPSSRNTVHVRVSAGSVTLRESR